MTVLMADGPGALESRDACVLDADGNGAGNSWPTSPKSRPYGLAGLAADTEDASCLRTCRVKAKLRWPDCVERTKISSVLYCRLRWYSQYRIATRLHPHRAQKKVSVRRVVCLLLSC